MPDRQALLLVDPPASWTSALPRSMHCAAGPSAATAPSCTTRACRLSIDCAPVETFASCGAAAGMIARSDETWPVWRAAESEEAVLRPGLRPRWRCPTPIGRGWRRRA